MKTNFAKLATVVLAVILVAGGLMGCGGRNTTTPPDELNKETELRIRQAILDLYVENYPSWNVTIDNIFIWRYLGTYNGAVVVLVGDTFMHIAIPGSNETIYVWKSARLYTMDNVFGLPNAYYNGVLTDDDIQAIYTNYQTPPPK